MTTSPRQRPATHVSDRQLPPRSPMTTHLSCNGVLDTSNEVVELIAHRLGSDARCGRFEVLPASIVSALTGLHSFQGCKPRSQCVTPPSCGRL